MTAQEVLARLEELGNPDYLAGMARYGIVADHPFGVRLPQQRLIARECGKSLSLALELWASGRHEARIVASLVAPPKEFTPETMDRWTEQFASWDVCDQCCGNLFRYTPYSWDKLFEYARREEEYVRRAGFVLAAEIAIGDKERADEDFRPVFALIREYSTDPRNFVKKAVNWALRQIGKRSHVMREEALALALQLAASEDRTARWIGKDAARELTEPKILARIKR